MRKSAEAPVWTRASSKNGLKTAILAGFCPQIAGFGASRDGKGPKIEIWVKKSKLAQHYGLKDPYECRNAPSLEPEVLR